jgi:hypothetical protein
MKATFNAANKWKPIHYLHNPFKSITKLMSMERHTGIPHYTWVKKFYFISLWATDLDQSQLIVLALMHTAYDQSSAAGRMGHTVLLEKQWRKARCEGEIWTNHETSSAHLLLCTKSKARKQVMMNELLVTVSRSTTYLYWNFTTNLNGHICRNQY